MTPPATPPVNPAPAGAPAKKGLSGLAWVGIGCGGLILLGIIASVIFSIFIVKKTKELGADFNENPERAAAELVINFNPEYEKVSTDDEAGTMTIRAKDGTVMTLTYEAIGEGRFTEEPAAAPVEVEEMDVAPEE